MEQLVTQDDSLLVRSPLFWFQAKKKQNEIRAKQKEEASKQVFVPWPHFKLQKHKGAPWIVWQALPSNADSENQGKIRR